MKRLFFIVLIIVILILGGIFLIGEAPEDVQRANIENGQVVDRSGIEDSEMDKTLENYDLSKLEFIFTGYGPGKSHDGTFKQISISDVKHDGSYVTKGKIKFVTNSVDTGIAKLDTDLCKENFFDCAKYPEIVFELIDSKKQEDGKIKAMGQLTMKGITKEVSFDLTEIAGVFHADFILDVNQFGFTAPNIVDNEVRIRFNSSL